MVGRHFVTSVALSLCLLVAAPSVHAQVRLGDKIGVSFQTIDNKKFSIRDLNGRLVILDFWATWCGPCIAQIPNMARIHEELGPKGVVIIGISLDRDRNAAEQVVRERNMNWLQVCDGRGWDSPHAARFGIMSIPRAFLISPAGELLWEGHPVYLDGPLAEAMAKFGPSLKTTGPSDRDQARERALTVIKEAATALEQADLRASLVSLMALDDKTLSDPKVASAMRDLAVKLLAEAEKEENAQKLAQDSEGPQLLKRLEVITKFAKPAPVAGVYGSVGLERVLEDKPAPSPAPRPTAAKPANTSDGEKLEALASRRLAQAERAAQDDRDIEAYEMFVRITELWPNTAASPKAEERVQAYRADAKFMARYDQAVMDRRARAAVTTGDNYRDAGQKEQAAEAYRRVIEQFPDTVFAAEAKRKLGELK